VPADVLSKIVYRVSLGEERERLKNTPGGTRFADAVKWSTSPFVTSNKDLIGLLATNLANAEAEGVRVVQIHMDDYNFPVYTGAGLQAFQSACDQIKQNMGSAGHEMISYCVKNVPMLRARIRDKMLFLSQHINETKFRFYRSHAACTLVIGEVAKELGIHDFDMAALEKFSIGLMKSLRSTVAATNSSAPEDAFARLVADFTQRIVLTYEYRDTRHEQGPELPLRQVVGVPAGRYVLGNRFEKEYAGRMFLNWREVRDWCMKNRVDMPIIVKYLTDKGALIAEKDKGNITRGTVIPGMQSEVMEIDTLKLDIPEERGELVTTPGLVKTGTV
jgi:hypothetical protein